MRYVIGCGALLALSLQAAAQQAQEAAPANQPPGWVRNFVRANDGRQFCVTPGARPEDFAGVIARYKEAHPELQGVLGGQDALAAFREAYPCPAAAVEEPAPAPAPEAPSTPPAPPVPPAPAAPQAEAPAIDVPRIVQTLLDSVGHENDALLAQIEKNPGDYPPPVLFAMSNLLYLQGRTDDALFWFNAARLRANFDTLRSADQSARWEVAEQMKMIPLALRRAQFDDLPKLRKIVAAVLKWDEDTPAAYDFHWISRDAAGVPPGQWPALAAKTRADYLSSLDEAIRQIEARR